jgi:cytochrome c oxidase subunit III
MRSARPSIEVSQLPNVVFDNRGLIWWATMGLIAIEGFMFAVALVMYFYLRTRSSDWPPGIDPPRLLWGTINVGLTVASIIPNIWIKQVAKKRDVRRVRIGLLVMGVVALVSLVIRAFEFPSLNCTWDANAYASVIWAILGLHTAHLLTDAYDTWVLGALFFTDRIEGRRLVDAAENADYWNFVVLTWVPIYLVIYIVPRIL